MIVRTMMMTAIDRVIAGGLDWMYLWLSVRLCASLRKQPLSGRVRLREGMRRKYKRCYRGAAPERRCIA